MALSQTACDSGCVLFEDHGTCLLSSSARPSIFSSLVAHVTSLVKSCPSCLIVFSQSPYPNRCPERPDLFIVCSDMRSSPWSSFFPCISSHSSTSIFLMCFPGTTTNPTNLFTISTFRFSVEPESSCVYAASEIAEGEGCRYSWVRERIMFSCCCCAVRVVREERMGEGRGAA